MSHGFLELFHDTTAFLIIAPEFCVQLRGRCMVIPHPPDDGLNFFLPEMSLIAMSTPIVPDPLFAAIQTHRVTVFLITSKTTANAAPYVGVAFPICS